MSETICLKYLSLHRGVWRLSRRPVRLGSVAEERWIRQTPRSNRARGALRARRDTSTSCLRSQTSASGKLAARMKSCETDQRLVRGTPAPSWRPLPAGRSAGRVPGQRGQTWVAAVGELSGQAVTRGGRDQPRRGHRLVKRLEDLGRGPIGREQRIGQLRPDRSDRPFRQRQLRRFLQRGHGSSGVAAHLVERCGTPKPVGLGGRHGLRRGDGPVFLGRSQGLGLEVAARLLECRGPGSENLGEAPGPGHSRLGACTPPPPSPPARRPRPSRARRWSFRTSRGPRWRGNERVLELLAGRNVLDGGRQQVHRRGVPGRVGRLRVKVRQPGRGRDALRGIRLERCSNALAAASSSSVFSRQ